MGLIEPEATENVSERRNLLRDVVEPCLASGVSVGTENATFLTFWSERARLPVKPAPVCSMLNEGHTLLCNRHTL